jgi:hypothetical protein
LVATAAHRTDHVLPDLPVQQWVLAVPKRPRYFLHRFADLQGAAGAIIFHAASELDALWPPVAEHCLIVEGPGSTRCCVSRSGEAEACGLRISAGSGPSPRMPLS